MNWSDAYKNQLDTVHAPDALKERLLAMEADADPADAPKMAAPRRKITKLRFGRVKRWQIAAALVCCIGLAAAAGPALNNSFGIQNYVLPETAAAGNGSAMLESPSEFAMDSASQSDSVAADTPDGAANPMDSRMLSRGVESHKVIYTADLRLESTDYTGTRAALEQAIADTNGYVQQTEESTQPNESRNLYCTYRIPVNRYHDFLDLAAAAGKVLHTSETADDVTTQYIDTQARLDALLANRDRLLELQQKAETLTDLLTIEEQLTQTQSELESWQAQLNYLEDQTDYCTVNLSLSEVKTYTPTQTSPLAKLADTFQRALHAFGNTLLDILLWIVYLWPWFLLIGIVLGLIFYLRKKRKNR